MPHSETFKAVGPAEQKATEEVQPEATSADATELRRAFMRQMAMSGFVAPAVLSTLLRQAAAQSAIILPPVEN